MAVAKLPVTSLLVSYRNVIETVLCLHVLAAMEDSVKLQVFELQMHIYPFSQIGSHVTRWDCNCFI